MINRDLLWKENRSAERKNGRKKVCAVQVPVWKKKCLRLDLNESREGFFLAERKQKVIPCRGAELEPAENWRGNQQWKVWFEDYGLTQTESIRSRAESTPRPGCGKLKRVTEKRRSR